MVSAIFPYVAIVRDTDGSAFITKAEFDSLKNNFQAQIDNYNSSIDNKIDGAIAAYLAGIKMETNQPEYEFVTPFTGHTITRYYAATLIGPEIFSTSSNKEAMTGISRDDDNVYLYNIDGDIVAPIWGGFKATPFKQLKTTSESATNWGTFTTPFTMHTTDLKAYGKEGVRSNLPAGRVLGLTSITRGNTFGCTHPKPGQTGVAAPGCYQYINFTTYDCQPVSSTFIYYETYYDKNGNKKSTSSSDWTGGALFKEASNPDQWLMYDIDGIETRASDADVTLDDRFVTTKTGNSVFHDLYGVRFPLVGFPDYLKIRYCGAKVYWKLTDTLVNNSNGVINYYVGDPSSYDGLGTGKLYPIELIKSDGKYPSLKKELVGNREINKNYSELGLQTSDKTLIYDIPFTEVERLYAPGLFYYQLSKDLLSGTDYPGDWLAERMVEVTIEIFNKEGSLVNTIELNK